MISTITLSNNPNQTFKVTIPGDTRNISLFLTQSYNTIAGYWVLGIYDISNHPIALNIPMLPGHDLLSQLQYLDIGSATIYNTGDASLPPDENYIDNYVLGWKLI